MSQATIDGPREHLLAKADHIQCIESEPAAWIYDSGDRTPCRQCGDAMQLAAADHIVVTLGMHPIHTYEDRRVRLCSEDCYREWASDGMDTGWA